MPTDLAFPLKRKKGYARLVSCESAFLNFEVSKKRFMLKAYQRKTILCKSGNTLQCDNETFLR